jgi:hypothetical protein
MATRADRDLQRAIIVTRVVTVGAVAVGMPVKDGAADHQVQPCADGVDMIGVVVALGNGAKVSGGAPGGINDEVQIAYLCGACVIPVKVGTGGAVRGKRAKVVADGFTSAALTVTTPVAADIAGVFTQSGSVGDVVGMFPALSWATE